MTQTGTWPTSQLPAAHVTEVAVNESHQDKGAVEQGQIASTRRRK